MLLPARSSLSVASVALLFLVPVVAAALGGGVWPALATAVGADLLVNFFFVPPFHTFAVERRDNLIALVVYLLVAGSMAAAVEVATRQREHAAGEAAHARELAEIDRLRSALLAAVGHDLRTPLAAIKAAVSSLRQADIEWPAEARAELLATVEESSDKLDGLVENLLSMSRLQAGVLSVQTRPVPLYAVVAQALLHSQYRGSTGRDQGTAVEVDVPEELPLVQADPGLLERVVANLVANAVAVSRDVLISAALIDSGLDGSGLDGSGPDGSGPDRSGTGGGGPGGGGTVVLCVIDHGPGVPAAERERIFAPFQRLHDRTASGGLGLGLAIARGFTEAMGARLTPSDTPGGGLTMTIALEVAA